MTALVQDRIVTGGRAPWWCARCDQPIWSDPHTDPATGGDVHAQCCTHCTSGATRGDQERQIADGPPPVVSDDGRPVIGGHPGPTTDQAARGEAA